MNFIWYILIGIVAGWIAGELTKGSGFGLVVNLIIGIIGGVLGGWSFDLLGVHVNEHSILGNLATATIGVILLLWIASLFRRSRL